MKFLHTGDIHLDSPFTLSDPGTAVERRNELRRSFSDMIDHVGVNKIPLLLIAGDLFESEYVTADTLSTVVKCFGRIPFCRIVISPGNHDPYTRDSVWACAELPGNVYVFKTDRLEKFSFDDINTDVYGFAFTSRYMERNPFAGKRPDDPGRINILCAHGDTASPISKYCPVTQSDIAGSGFDYIALGHIHLGSGGIKETGGVHYAYCGTLEGRDFSECGHKGAILAEIKKASGHTAVSGEMIRFSQRRYEWLKLDMTGAAEADEVKEAVRAGAEKNGYGKDTLLRVTLTGSVAPSLGISEADIREVLPDVYSFELRDETVPVYGSELLEKDPTVRGEFYRLLLPMLESGDPEERRTAANALKYGLSALSGGADLL